MSSPKVPPNSGDGSDYFFLREKSAEERLFSGDGETLLPRLSLHDEVRCVEYLFKDRSKGFEAKADLWLLPKAQMQSVLSTREILSEEDIRFGETISHEPTRHRYTAMRILSRIALSHFSEQQVPVEGWAFRLNSFGKPEVISPHSDICFNISHSEDVSVVAISDCQSIGVDIEFLSSAGLGELPLHVLSDAEKERLNSLGGRDKYEAFLDYWTLKEAYAKAEGKGFSLDFEKLEVSLQPLSLSFLSGEAINQPLLKTMTLSHHAQYYKIALCLQD